MFSRGVVFVVQRQLKFGNVRDGTTSLGDHLGVVDEIFHRPQAVGVPG